MIRILAEAAGDNTFFANMLFGGIAMGLFLLLGWVTWSFRDVSNRHADKSNDSQAHH